jgi:hypothetical protein
MANSSEQLAISNPNFFTNDARIAIDNAISVVVIVHLCPMLTNELL